MRLYFVLLATSLLVLAPDSKAQRLVRSATAATPSSTASDTTCTYSSCALRVEPGLRGPRLVRGRASAVAVELGGLTPPSVDELFASSDSAATYAARYTHAERVNRLLTYGGIIAGAVGLSQADRSNGYTFGGLGALLASIPFQHSAERSLSRAVWWYNAALPTTPSAQK